MSSLVDSSQRFVGWCPWFDAPDRSEVRREPGSKSKIRKGAKATSLGLLWANSGHSTDLGDAAEKASGPDRIVRSGRGRSLVGSCGSRLTACADQASKPHAPFKLSRFTGALSQPRARTKGEARVDLCSARSNLQRLIGNVQKYFLLRFLCDARHDIDPFCLRPAC